MKGWITLWANRVGIVGSCAILLGNVLLGNSVLISVIRALVVGFALYLVMLILGSMVLNALIMLAAERVAYKEEMGLTEKPAPQANAKPETKAVMESQAVEVTQVKEPRVNTSSVQTEEALTEEPAA